MFLELRPKQTLVQKLVLTPQLQQAIKLLKLSRVELEETIRQELAENPALEETNETKAEDGLDDFGGLYEYLNPYHRSNATLQTEAREQNSFETYTARRETLTDHILQQFLMVSPTAEEEEIGSLIAGSLNSKGYLTVSLEEISDMSACELYKVERVLVLMQAFDPPGVCARDLRECLLLQIKRRNPDDSAAARIVTGHLEDLAKRDYRSISKALGIALEDVIAADRFISSLEPRPGRQFADMPAQYIEPDIFVTKIKDEFVISLNNSGMPVLRISSLFKEALRKANAITDEANEYLKEKLQSAQWLIKSIQERQQTIYQVMGSILKFQRSFFEKGVSHLRPMVLRDVAEDIDRSESTVSRVTTNKYAHTPQGIFELKYFFSSGVGSRDGGPVSSTVVQERIKRVVAAEDARKPLSDEKIAKVLRAEGIDIARRTVAKYRENLGILASNRRKRFEPERK
jgi:RNA polymerase sigma-54 factor